MLDGRVKENEEKVQILKMPSTSSRKKPNWRSASLRSGQALADYMIDVEIEEMDLFAGSRGQWLLGHATSVNAYDLSKPVRT